MQTLVLAPSSSAPTSAEGRPGAALDSLEALEALQTLERHWHGGACVALVSAAEQPLLEAALGPVPPPLGEHGPAVLLGSGGSSGGRRWCLQPLAHLEASAEATARWLLDQGLDPAACLHLNPLPLHHVSGLMPWLRARRWGADHRLLPPALLRDGAALAQQPLPAGAPVLLSLVPTQLQRLLPHPEAVAWLRRCAVIWVGGAALPPALAERARSLGLPLAPCYGSTETAAMVAALAPARFLAGADGCGPPLADCRLRLGPDGAVEVATPRLSPGWLERGRLLPLPRCGPWWRSGDAGRIDPEGLQLFGRLDGAISSGGETVFPEQLEERLRQAASAAGLPLAAVLLLGRDDPLWGQRLEALLRPLPAADPGALRRGLQALVAAWPPAERPRAWHHCPQLATSEAGKWQRGRWRRWLAARDDAKPQDP